MPRMSGGEALARTLLACGVDHVFGMTVGGQVPFTVSAIRAGMRMMTLRDEKCAALAATAFSRTSGRPGVCISSNPGAAHMALGMHEAHLSDVPMLAISMDVGTASLWRGAAYYDQQAMFQAVTKLTLRAEGVVALPDMVRQRPARRHHGTPRPCCHHRACAACGLERPTSLTVLLATPQPRPSHFPALRTPPAPDVIGQAADLLASAERPAILAGGGDQAVGCLRRANRAGGAPRHPGGRDPCRLMARSPVPTPSAWGCWARPTQAAVGASPTKSWPRPMWCCWWAPAWTAAPP